MPGSKRYSVSKQEEIWNRQQIRHQSVSAYGQRKSDTNDGWSLGQTIFVYLPVIDAIIVISTFFICYFLPETENSSRPLGLPFPTEIALDDPHSRIFSLGISLSSIVTLLLFTFKYKQVDSIFSGFINQLSFTFGIIASVSQYLLGNFPMLNDMVWMNIISVIGFLLFTILYFAVQVYLTRNTPAISSKRTYIIRILILELMLLSGALLCAFLVPGLSQWNRTPYNVAQIASWCCVAFIMLYKLTFVSDLKQMYFQLNILISPSQAETIYQGNQKQLLIEEDSTSARMSTRSKISRSSVKSSGTMSEINTIYNYPVFGKSSV